MTDTVLPARFGHVHARQRALGGVGEVVGLDLAVEVRRVGHAGMPGMVSIFFGTAVVGAVGAAVLPSAGTVVGVAWFPSPPPPHATATSASAVRRTTIRRAQRRSELWRSPPRACGDGWEGRERREDKAATLRGASRRTRAPPRACPRRVGLDDRPRTGHGTGHRAGRTRVSRRSRRAGLEPPTRVEHEQAVPRAGLLRVEVVVGRVALPDRRDAALDPRDVRPVDVGFARPDRSAEAGGRRRRRERVQRDPRGRDELDVPGLPSDATRRPGGSTGARGSRRRRPPPVPRVPRRRRTRWRTGARRWRPASSARTTSSASGSTTRPASSIASRAAALRAASSMRGVVVDHHAVGVVLRVDAAAGEHPGTAREREPRVAPQHERLDAVGAVAEQHDGRGRDRRWELVFEHGVGHAPTLSLPRRRRALPPVTVRRWRGCGRFTRLNAFGSCR